MNAEGDLIPAVVEVMCDSIDGGEHLGFAQRNDALGLRVAVVPLVNGEPAAHRGEYGPAFGMRMLRVLRADWPEQDSRVQPRRIRRRDWDLKLTLEELRRGREIFRDGTGAKVVRREKLR